MTGKVEPRTSGARRRWAQASGQPLSAASVSAFEAAVLAGVASGRPDAEIADLLGYSTDYVKEALQRVRHRFGARDRAHAAAIAVAASIVKKGEGMSFVTNPPGRFLGRAGTVRVSETSG